MLLWGRLSLLVPASIRYRTFAFEEGRKPGRDKTWKLLGLWIILLLIGILIGIVVMILFLIVMLTVGGGMQAFNPEAIEAWITGLPQQAALLAGLAVVLLIPMAWLLGFSQTLFTAPFAHVVQVLAEAAAPDESPAELH